jgi:hypothetical protein
MAARCCLDIDETKGELWCGWLKDEQGVGQMIIIRQ